MEIGKQRKPISGQDCLGQMIFEIGLLMAGFLVEWLVMILCGKKVMFYYASCWYVFVAYVVCKHHQYVTEIYLTSCLLR